MVNILVEEGPSQPVGEGPSWWPISREEPDAAFIVDRDVTGGGGGHGSSKRQQGSPTASCLCSRI